MNEYLIALISVSAVVALASFISYDPADKSLRAALAVILLFTSVSPILGAVGGIREADIREMLGELGGEDVALGDTEYAKSAEEAFCLGIEKMVCEEFSLERSDVCVYAFEFNVEKMRAEKIKILLSGGAVLADSRAICARVEGGGLGECEVALELSG